LTQEELNKLCPVAEREAWAAKEAQKNNLYNSLDYAIRECLSPEEAERVNCVANEWYQRNKAKG
jgi:hypothetical protein